MASAQVACCKKYVHEKIYSAMYEMGTSVYVYVTSVTDPDYFFALPFDLLPILRHIELPRTPVIEKPILWMYCSFYSQIRKKWIRGQITKISDKDEASCNIFALDYGFEEKQVPVVKIRELMYCHRFKPLAIRCKLDHCSPMNGKTWDSNSIDGFRFYVENCALQLTVLSVGQDMYTVDLKDHRDNIATLLVMSERALFKVPPCNVKLANCGPNHRYPHKVLNAGEMISIRVLSGVSMDSFYVACVKDFKDFHEIKYNYTKICKMEKHVEQFDLVKGMAVVVYPKGYYHRAEISDTNLSNNKVEVFLVDLGRKEQVPMNYIKHIPENYLKIPPLALYCTATEQCKHLNNLLWPGERFDMEIINVGNKFHEPHLVNIEI